LGEKLSRYTSLGMIFLQYILVVYLVITGFFTPLMLIVFFSIPVLRQIIPLFRHPKPEEKPADYPDVWPNYFVAAAFVHNRRFGLLFLLGLILDTIAVYAMRILL
jgi:1,4-dihydroxy-2-naphthoate octaprenyltransferase